MWPFFMVPPAYAYSFFWAAAAALMLVGWSVMLRVFGFGRAVAAYASAILYFSPFVQAWSGPSPLFSHSLRGSLFVRPDPFAPSPCDRPRAPGARLADEHVLLPAVRPLLFLGVFLCLAFKPEVFAVRRLAGAIAGQP